MLLSPARSILLIPVLAAGAAAGPRPEDFSRGMDDWWVEGGERVWVQDGRLHVKADPDAGKPGAVATVWWKTPHAGDFELSVDAHVVSSSVRANNINLFFCYSDPSGTPLIQSRESRASAEYGLYHKLNGYIVTFLNDARGEGGRNPDGSTRARVRIRRNPGFRLLAETFAGECREKATYRLALRKTGGRIRFSVNGRPVLEAEDAHPHGGGLLGLRTFRTCLWWDNVRIAPPGAR